jgi:hypothetical protein
VTHRAGKFLLSSQTHGEGRQLFKMKPNLILPYASDACTRAC